MLFNPFDPSTLSSNDIEGFKLPYRLVSRSDHEVMERRYLNLTKSSYGAIVRLGIKGLI